MVLSAVFAALALAVGPKEKVGLFRASVLGDTDGTAPAWDADEFLDVSIAPNEVEAVAFTVRGSTKMHGAKIRIVRSTVPGGVQLLWIERRATRTTFRADQHEHVGRFARPLRTDARIKLGQPLELWARFDPPANAPGGVYVATVAIDANGRTRERHIRVRIRDIALVEPTNHALAMHYRVHAIADDEARVQRELEDMHTHGIRRLVLDARPLFRRAINNKNGNEGVHIDTTRLEHVLQLVHAAGFDDRVVVDAGLVPLAQKLGHADVAYADAAGASLDRAPKFRAAVRQVSRRFVALQRAFPSQQLGLVMLDEVFDRGRLPLFLRFSQAMQTALPVYAPLSTRVPEFDALLQTIGAHVQLRAFHGYSFEWWLARGGDVARFERELVGDSEAWLYHNDRGLYFTGRWARLVNGLYLWASPFSCHLTWAYQAFAGSPFDDRDGGHHDVGMAFPDARNPDVLVPTRLWVALREGFDDLRYIATLERAIARNRSRAPHAAAAAQRFLDELRLDVMRLPSAIDADRLATRIGTPDEAPLLSSLASRYNDARLAWIRARVEEHIVALTVAGSL